jgi:transcriptional regulator with XRE-family HTH domain
MSGDIPQLSTFADRLKWARIYRGYETVTKLARAIDMSPRQLYRLEDPKVPNTTTAATMAKLAELLQVDAGWLAFGHGLPFPLPTVVAYLQSERGKKLSPEVAKRLLEWPLDFFGTITPTDEDIRDALVSIDFLLHRARNRGHGDHDR